MVKKIECRVIDSVSFNVDGRGVAEEFELGRSSVRENATFAFYKILMYNCRSEREISELHIDLLA